MEELISIIIPIYNVEKYLNECINSVIGQTYKNLEIILINDGSTDESKKICKYFKSIDSRIILINSKNNGGGAAKNIGLDVCNGKYIMFVDSDDYIKKDMVEKLYLTMHEKKVDIVQCNIYLLYKNKLKIKNKTPIKKIFSQEEFLCMTCKDWSYYVIYNKLYKRELIRDIRFPEGTIIDDEYFTYKIIGNAINIFEIEEPMYYYRQRKGSLMHNEDYKLKRDQNEIEICKLENEYIKKNFPNILDCFHKKTIDSFLRVCYRNFKNEFILSDVVKYLKKNCIASIFKLYSFKEIIWILLFLIFPKNVCLYNSKKNKDISCDLDSFFD